jgi:hypothetical protein
MIASEIESFLCGPDEEMRIANAGGRTVRDMIDSLERLVPVPPKIKGKRLRFLSLNAAESHDSFDECSNFLSVRLAQLFGGEHFAVMKHWDEETAGHYHEALEKVDLLISSAGSRDGFLSYWLGRKGLSLPPEAVGDIAFHPIDALGRPARLPDSVTSSIDKGLLRAPDWNDLVRFLLQKKVILLLTGDKAELGNALLGNGLATRCVIDSQLALVLSKHQREN